MRNEVDWDLALSACLAGVWQKCQKRDPRALLYVPIQVRSREGCFFRWLSLVRDRSRRDDQGLVLDI